MKKNDIFNAAKFVMSVNAQQKLGESQAEVAFVGRSNVGKSSLLNALCNQRSLANVSKTPGRTRSINVFSVKPGKWIIDLPGYGFAAVSKDEKNNWQSMLQHYLSGRPALKAIFVLVDAYVGVTKLDRQMIEWLNEMDLPYIVVANKTDRVAPDKNDDQRQALALDLLVVPEAVIWASAKTGAGIADLQDIVFDLLELG
ncbi:MAG: ribosome biogenesis GTP-binding protein YihA/YsxC [Elusimicrobiota bacterium]